MIQNQTDDLVRTNACPTCYICKKPGKLVYDSVTDKLFGAPGNWRLLACSDCVLIWLDPQPVSDDLVKIYNTYYTHQPGLIRWFMSSDNPIRAKVLIDQYGYDRLKQQIKINLSSTLISYLPSVREIVGMSILKLGANQVGKLLDVGCGNGQFLNNMRNLGWEVYGTEIDSKAVETAQNEYNLNVKVGTLNQAHFLDEFFDVITLNHVIEHIYDPVELIRECQRITRPGGKIVLTTPNIKSLGHLLFLRNWRGLEVPRHLLLFSPSSIQKCLEQAGFHVSLINTSARMSRDIFTDSILIRKSSSWYKLSKPWRALLLITRWLFQLFEENLITMFSNLGEEIYIVGIRDYK
jgi:2-polyprenyl-3-methyl-5-hydroxy-6-metoxy-1,4-benzoquinol methylase